MLFFFAHPWEAFFFSLTSSSLLVFTVLSKRLCCAAKTTSVQLSQTDLEATTVKHVLWYQTLHVFFLRRCELK